jgi:2-polyprenyl-3-methyl-5-hydroxy-6-metoxy-1,4-benzoquinol methylase
MLITLPSTVGSTTWGRLRRVARGIRGLRSTWYLVLAVAAMFRDRPSHAPEESDRQYKSNQDPWGYRTPWGKQHLDLTMEFLNTARIGDRFQRALEIGCGGGDVTELLADRCDSVLAVDISPVALQLARERCKRWTHVRFAQWDLRRDPPVGVFDLLLVMGVIECFCRPQGLLTARSKIADMLLPGGYLLTTFTKQNEIFETAWWGRWLPRGSLPLRDFLARHRSLHLCATKTTDTHLFALYRKIPADDQRGVDKDKATGK